MIIGEAIKRLKARVEYGRTNYPDFPIDDVQLGIEALKREQEWRRRWPHQSHLPFPGETEE